MYITHRNDFYFLSSIFFHNLTNVFIQTLTNEVLVNSFSNSMDVTWRNRVNKFLINMDKQTKTKPPIDKTKN